ncbi:hypothetical protein AMTR_s00129p00046360 [Amborella trichopoda]|uniref:Uncharacterized protein n=1 Tax=Amborella trichopoda TaxID=13333 RepID=W1NKF3_AMBTC|nr:hypothetical protein AMTR_s00129p00046360 [Amborella trichopoda]
MELEEDGLIDPFSAVFEGVVEDPLASVAQPSQQSLIAYFAMYAREDSGDMNFASDSAEPKVAESRCREKGPFEAVIDDVGTDILATMFDDMGGDFDVPIRVVLEEMEAKKKEEKL